MAIDKRKALQPVLDTDSANRLDRVLASMQIGKKEFDDVTNTYDSLVWAPIFFPAEQMSLQIVLSKYRRHRFFFSGQH